jgi:hypothetical protein
MNRKSEGLIRLTQLLKRHTALKIVDVGLLGIVLVAGILYVTGF